MGKSVHSGEVIGFTVAKIWKDTMEFIHVQFSTQDEAESYCDSMNDSSSKAKYFAVKMSSVANAFTKDPTYDISGNWDGKILFLRR